MKNTVVAFLLLFSLFSCRKYDTFEGPSLNDLLGEFSIIEPITVNSRFVDFTAGESLFFTGEISKSTTWEIEFVGAQSGAQGKITGNDRILTSANASWEGGAITFPGFSQEDVYISIHFPDEDSANTLYDTINITGTKPDLGVLITDFESGTGSNWSFFKQTTVAAGINCDDQAAKGSCSYQFEGAVPWDWAIGSVTILPESNSFELPASATDLYFNLGLKVTENVGPENSFLLFWFDEDDNEDGQFDEASEDRWIYEHWSTDTTWELISKKYSDLKTSESEIKGNGLLEPSKIHSITLFFLANPQNGKAKAALDHLIFTQNQAYQP